MLSELSRPHFKNKVAFSYYDFLSAPISSRATHSLPRTCYFWWMINLSMSWESGNKDAGGKPKQQQERQSGWGRYMANKPRSKTGLTASVSIGKLQQKPIKYRDNATHTYTWMHIDITCQLLAWYLFVFGLPWYESDSANYYAVIFISTHSNSPSRLLGSCHVFRTLGIRKQAQCLTSHSKVATKENRSVQN